MVLTDAQGAELSPLIKVCRPRGKTQPGNLRRTITAILWRYQNGATRRAIPAELGPWWEAAQTFNRCAHLGVWERLQEQAQARGMALAMSFLDGTRIRSQHKAAGTVQEGGLPHSAMRVRRLAAFKGGRTPRVLSSGSIGIPAAGQSRSAKHNASQECFGRAEGDDGRAWDEV